MNICDYKLIIKINYFVQNMSAFNEIKTKIGLNIRIISRLLLLVVFVYHILNYES